MNWRIWLKIDEMLLEMDIKPIIAVIPNNRDREFFIEKEREDFWNYVRERQKIGWVIGVHGYQHLCITRNGGILGIYSCSEFAGLSEREQEEKIVKALEILKTNNIKPDLFIAPWHSFDYTTLHVLKKHSINVISDGFSLLPHIHHGVLWIPQQLWWFPKRTLPIGVWTVVFHHNSWKNTDLERFWMDLNRFHGKIGDPRTIITRYSCRKKEFIDNVFSYVLKIMLKIQQVYGYAVEQKLKNHLKQSNGRLNEP